MPEIKIEIGGRVFEVACQEGEEHYLHSAAAMLDAEASTLTSQIGRLPEPRMLLMAGLMLADKTAGVEDKLKSRDARIAELENEIARLSTMPAPTPERIEVPVVPVSLSDSMAELAARAESIAGALEERLGAKKTVG
ncbi:cell division protein ZapA [Lentibacter sp. XHP0401]|jgi:cell division protein ZapA|uniref:cell division protein ZapA n=1 Tax=Lentibacter sp. XHP0401 TaxID=2984334 RepID=UPI0021E83627|nr:cell division protein ZapA [Lentibacter sp. XHP0401]MCV2891948.1 cell division protein ZapA [Lentibacter sp. XHP0401]